MARGFAGLACRRGACELVAQIADITYIRLMDEFILLAVVLDAFSRRVLGWELAESLQTSLAIGALERALADRPVAAGVIHHSDRRRQTRWTVCGNSGSKSV